MIDWDKHPKAAYADVTFFDEHHCDIGSQLDISRPKQKKTVAHAYEWAKGEWRGGKSNAIAYNPNSDYFSYCEGEGLNKNWYLVCTRAEFEAYVKEQEGEKWTHKLGHGNCRIKFEEPDEFGYVLIELEGQGYKLYKPSQLKPIKPSITKAEAWDMLLKTDESIRKLDDAVFAIVDKHDII